MEAPRRLQTASCASRNGLGMASHPISVADSGFARATANALVSPSGMVETPHLQLLGPGAQGVENQHVDG